MSMTDLDYSPRPLSPVSPTLSKLQEAEVEEEVAPPPPEPEEPPGPPPPGPPPEDTPVDISGMSRRLEEAPLPPPKKKTVSADQVVYVNARNLHSGKSHTSSDDLPAVEKMPPLQVYHATGKPKPQPQKKVEEPKPQPRMSRDDTDLLLAKFRTKLASERLSPALKKKIAEQKGQVNP